MSESNSSEVERGTRKQRQGARIVLAITDTGDRRVLQDWLSERYEVTVAENREVFREATADLYIIDPITLDQNLSVIREGQESLITEILPILLVQHEACLPLDAEEREYIDDVVSAPVDKHELAWRIGSLLQKRELSRELVAENDRLNEFASSVSHDLRNPLRTVRGYIELTQETEEIDHLGEAETALDRANAMIDNLLQLARYGEESIDPVPASLSDLVENAWQTVDTQSATLELDTVPALMCDGSHVQRLLENLFRNAVEHGGKDVTVRIGALEEQEGFYVEDNGPGIPSDQQEQVFEQGISRKDSGTGFGLSHVEEIANAHGWSVKVMNADSGGARFEITTSRTK